MKSPIIQRSPLLFFLLILTVVFQSSSWASGNWIDASAGSDHTIALKSDGRVFAAGSNSSGQLGDGTTNQSGIFKLVATGVTDVAAYGTVSYILKSDGTVWKTTSSGAWSQTLSGVSSLKEFGTGVYAVKTGIGLFNALNGSEIKNASAQSLKAYAIGPNSSYTNKAEVLLNGQFDGLSNIIEVGVGDNNYVSVIQSCWYSCSYTSTYQNTAIFALLSDGNLYHKGTNSSGIAGAGTTWTTSNAWLNVLSGVQHVEATASPNGSYSVNTTFAVLTDGRLMASGQNGLGQMGDGTTANKTSWTQVATGVALAKFGGNKSSTIHSVLVKTDGTLWVTGQNSNKQHGLNDTANRTSWTQTGILGALTVSKGVYADKISLAWTSEGDTSQTTFEVWRSEGKNNTKSLLATVTGLSYDDTTAVEGKQYGYYIKVAGTVSNTDYGYRKPPTFTSTSSGNWKDASVGDSHTIALKTDGRVFAAGSNSYGQLGDGTTALSGVFKQVATGVTDVAAYANTSYILKSDGTVWKTTSSGTWSMILSGVSKLQEHSLGVNAIKTDGTTWNADNATEWKNGAASLKAFSGNSSFNVVINQDGSATAVAGWGLGGSLPSVKDVTGYGYYDCWYSCSSGGYGFNAILTDGKLLSMGLASSVWDESFNNARNILARVGGSYSTNFSQFLTQNDGSLWVGGTNAYGQLGLGSTSAPSTLTRSASGTLIAAPGNFHSVLVKTDGTLWVTGRNNSKQHGLNDATDRYTWTQTGIVGDLTVSKGDYTDKISLAWTSEGDTSQNTFEVWRSEGKYGTKSLLASVTGLSYDDTTAVEGKQYGYYIKVAGNISNTDYGYRKPPAFTSTSTGNWKDASVGDSHTIALKTDGRVFATGLNSSGQLGDGTTSQSGVFKQVATGVTDVAAYANTSYILKSDGTVWKTTSSGAWSQTMTGVSKLQEHSLGVNAIKTDGTTWNADNATEWKNGAASLKAFSGQLAINYWDSSAHIRINQDGSAYAYGYNFYGSLPSVKEVTGYGLDGCPYACYTFGSGFYAIKTDDTFWFLSKNSTPLPWEQYLDKSKSALIKYSGPSYSSNFLFITQNDGSLWVSGVNTGGQLGLGTSTNPTTFTRSASGALVAVPGSAHSIHVKTDGTLWVTGQNASKQHGLNDTTNRTSWTQTGFIQPSKVAGVNATDGTLYSKVNISWTADPDATSYEVYRSTTAGTKGSLLAGAVTQTSYEDTTVSGSTHYFYTVVAKNPVGSGPDSDQNEGYGKVPATLAISATQGTQNGKVTLAWTSNPDATGYQIWRSTTAGGTATQVTTLTAMPASGFEDVTVSGVSSYFYTVKTVVGSLVGPASNEVEGWANGAPTAASASVTASSTAPSAATSPTITDPNVTAGKTETYTLAITTPPTAGDLAIVGGKFVYTPPADGLFSGPLTFDFTATDKGGSLISGTGSINVVCGSPTISAFTLSSTSVIQATPFDASGSYSYPACSTNNQIKVDVLDGSNLVVVSGTPVATPNGAGQSHTFTSAGVLTAGSYTVRMTATSDSGSATKTATLTVKAVNLPTLNISPGLNITVGEEAVTATLTESATVNCPLTNDPAVATAAPTKCYVAFATPPSGISIDNSGALPSMSGIIDTAGSYPITAEVYKHDGTSMQKIGQVSKTVTASCVAPSITSLDIPALLPHEVPNYASTYKAYSCNGALTGSIIIKKNTNVIETLPLSSLGWGSAATLTQSGTGLAAGNYTAELSIVGSYGTGGKTQSFQVKAAPMPTLTVSPNSAPQGETRVDASLTPSTDTSCPLTTNQAEAEADPKKCYVVLSTTLTDMTAGTDTAGLPTLAGYPATVGEYAVQAVVSRWVNGTRYDSDPLTKNVKVTEVVAPVFALTGKSDLYVGIEKASLIFKQSSGTTCTLYTDQAAAQTEASKGKRACFVTFTGDQGLTKTLSLNQYKLEGALTSIGTQTIGFTVKRQFADGLSTELQTGGLDLTVNDLPPPVVTLKGGYKISDGKYYVPLNQAITRATITAGVPTNAKMKITVTDSQQTFERGGVMNGGSYWISTPNLGLLEERPVTLRVAWQDYPQVYQEQVITAVGGTESNMKLVIDSSQQIADTEQLTVKVNVGKYTKTGINYTAETMGNWRIQILAQTNTQTIKTPITETKEAVNGEATFQINPAGNLFMKLTAVAELISNVEGLDTTLTSSTRYVEVVKGSPIEGTISAKTLDGPAPKTFTLNLDMTLDNRVALKEVTWERSADGGVTWEPQDKSNTIRHNVPLASPGKVKARAKMINKNTLVESYTTPVEVWAYSTLDAQIVGPRHVAPGYPVTLAAQLYREGVLTTDTVNEWTIEAPSGKTTQTGSTVTISEETEGKIYLTLRSRPSDTRADDPYAWSATRNYVVVATPTRPSIYAKGPRDVETGKNYHYEGTVRPSWGTVESVHNTASEWVLPDGSTVSGETLDWSPTVQDMTDTKQLVFRSWVNGFKETTTSETTVTYVPWEYVWPNWSVSLRQLTIQAPSDLILLVKHDRLDMNRRFEGLTYEWSFPSGVTGRQNEAFPNRAMAQALYAGEYDIQVTIRDSRGHQTTLTQHVTAEQAVPYTVTLKVGKSNYYDRAPMTVTVRPVIYGGHPLDSVIGQAWKVDGMPIDDFVNRSYMVNEILEAGSHTISYTLSSKMGETATVDSPLFLVANQPPICELVAKPNAYVVYAEASCKDADGKVIGYSWQVDGQPIGSTSYRISFSKTATPQTAHVTITAMDDAKELSTPVSVDVNY